MKQYLIVALVALAAAPFAACSSKESKNPSAAAPADDDDVPGDDDDHGDDDDDDTDGGPAKCPAFAKPTTVTKVQGGEFVNETSGIVASKVNPDHYWIHNDSGEDIGRTFAFNKDGEVVLELTFDEKKPVDIEDMTVEDTEAGAANLFFADIGDNDEKRETLTIHRVAEPDLSSIKGNKLKVTSEKMTVVYPDGAHNAETLMFDAATKELYIATKKHGGPSYIHRVGPFEAGGKVTTKKIATVDIDYATGGDISRDGKYIVIRNSLSSKGFLWTREQEGEDLASVFKREPCEAPFGYEKQGEAVGWLPDTSGYVSISEGTTPDLHQTLFKK